MYAASPLDPQDGPKRCSACAKSKDDEDRNQTFPTADSLWAHITTVHLLWTPFECTLCPMMYLPTENVLQQHYAMTHPGKVPKAIYTYMKKKTSKIRQIFLESQKLSESYTTNSNRVSSATFRSNSEAKRTLRPWKMDSEISQIDPPQNDVIISDSEEEEEVLPIEKQERTNQPAIGLYISDEELEIDNNRGTNVEGDQMDLEEEGGVKQEIRKVVVKQEKETYRNYRRKPQYMPTFRKTARKIFQKNRGGNNCKFCARVVPRNNRNQHIWKLHMSTQRYVCRHCGYGNAGLRQIEQHVQKKGHENPDEESSWTENTKALSTEYKRVFFEAFGD